MVKFKIFLILSFGIFLLGSVSAGNLSLFPNNINLASTNVAYEFNFSNSTNCLPENIILSYSKILTFNSRGVAHISIDITNLTEVPISLCEYRDGSLMANHSPLPSAIFSTIYSQNINVSNNLIVKGSVNVTNNVTAGNFLGNINASYIQNEYFVNESGDTMTGNLNISDNNLTTINYLIFTLGEMIDNVVDGWIRITGGLNVTENLEVGGNVTASYFLGDGSELTSLTETTLSLPSIGRLINLTPVLLGFENKSSFIFLT